MERIEIPLKRTRMIVGLFVAVAFIALGIYLLILAQSMDGYPVVLYILGGFLVAIFAYLFIFSTVKLLGTKIGLVIDDEGITDHSNIAIGTIRWEDITDIRVDSVMMNKAVVFYTESAKAQSIYKSAKGMQKRMLKSNLQMFGSPLAVISTNVKISIDDLHRMVLERYENHNSRKEIQE